MIARIALAMTLGAGPAMAGTWNCTLKKICDTEGKCETPQDAPITADLAIAADGGSAVLTLGHGGDDDKTLNLTGVHKTADTQSFMAEIEDGTLGFFTIWDNGDLIASSHEKGAFGASGVAVQGSCTRAAN